MSLELDNDGPFVPRRAPVRNPAAPAWPVLAQLPRVQSDPPDARAALPMFAPPEPAAREPLLSFVDAPHQRPAPEPAQHRTHAAPAAPRRDAPAATRHYRIDQGDSPRPMNRRETAPQNSDALSDRVFQTYAAITPHLGKVTAAVFLLSLGLMYFLVVARPAAQPLSDGLQPSAPAALTQETPAEPESPASAPPAETAPANVGTLDAPPAIDWDLSPRMANAPADERTDAPATVEQTLPNAVDTASPPTESSTTPDAPANSPLPADAAAVINPASNMATAPLLDDHGVTPTPHIDPYPSTPFPPFGFAIETPPESSRNLAGRASTNIIQ